MIGNGIACVVVGRWVGELNKEQLTDTLRKKGKDVDILDELEDEIETEIGDVLSPQQALVPISIKESVEQR